MGPDMRRPLLRELPTLGRDRALGVSAQKAHIYIDVGFGSVMLTHRPWSCISHELLHPRH